MKTEHLKGVTVVALLGLLGCSMMVVGKEATRLERQVYHELVMLPYHGVFDNLEFRVNDSKVTLMGQVTNPMLKDSAGRVVKSIEAVTSVDNRIEVLPNSPNDDRVRLDVFRSIYYHPNFIRYATRVRQPIHIIVKRGDVTLVGVVATQFDKTIADHLAKGVAGVFSVTNQLTVDKDE